MSAVLGQGVELDHRVLEKEPVVHVVATAAGFNHAAFLPERDGHGRVGVRRPGFAVVVLLARPVANLVGQRFDSEAVGGQVDRRPGELAVGVERAAVLVGFAVPMGDPGCLSLFGRKPEFHRLLAEHLTSEYRVKTEGRGRTVDEWKLRVDGLDNHWLDCLVGCAVAASIQGAVLFGTDVKPTPRPRVRLSDLQGARR